MKLKDHFTDSISTAGGASLTQKADKGEAFKGGLDVFFTCIECVKLLCGLLFWKTTRTLFPTLLRTLWRRRQVPSGTEFKIQTSGSRKCLFMLPDRIK